MAVTKAVFNVSLIVRDKAARWYPHTTAFEERGAEAESNRDPTAYQPNTVPLHQASPETGSLSDLIRILFL